MLRVEGLEVRYGGLIALRGITLRVEQGELVGLIGPNGAGKSTTLSTIAGSVAPNAGTLTFEGEPLPRRSPETTVGRGVALVPEGRRIFGRLTVEENLRLGATIRRDREVASDIEAMIERFPVLGRYRHATAGKLSGGEQQQLAIGRALMSRPRLLLLDEPSLGLAPIVVSQVFDLLEDLRREGMTILLVEQNARRTLQAADRTYVLQNGALALETTRESADIETVERAYFGVDDEASTPSL